MTRVLFARYRTAVGYAAADRAELEAVIHPTGYFRAKANTLISLGRPPSTPSKAASARDGSNNRERSYTVT
jgi:hypothetical protein